MCYWGRGGSNHLHAFAHAHALHSTIVPEIEKAHFWKQRGEELGERLKKRESRVKRGFGISCLCLSHPVLVIASARLLQVEE